MFCLYAFFFGLTTIYCIDLYTNIPFNNNNYNRQQLQPSVTNLSTVVGETISFNCSIITLLSNDYKLQPTWLKADVVYNQYGTIISYKTENIIITRKGIIVDSLRDKIKLITVNNNEQFHFTLKLTNVNIKNEGKYICREFNSQLDKLFLLNVYSGVAGLNMKFSSNSKYFRIIQSGSGGSSLDPAASSLNDEDNNFIRYGNSLTSSISVKENDELIVNCTVNSSKPAANLSVWILPNHRTANNDEESRRIELNELFTVKNKDLTLKTTGIARIIVNRFDNLKSVTCIAENNVLDEKWETKKILNVLYSPRCSKYQKLVYNTGINQTIELECRMTDANPPYLNFNWKLANELKHNNNNNNLKEKFRTSGFTSRIKFKPESIQDFGQISCYASNGLEDGECKMQLQLGGTPNPPYDCFHKENNKTIIIECKPGFDQGDPEVYFYLLKKKPAGILVEYARKRDSCSFLISNLILEEHLNDFYIYSSNKYGHNKDHATKLTIENKEFLLKNLEQLRDTSNENSKRITLIVTSVCVLCVLFIFFVCILVKCYNNSMSDKKLSYSSTDSTSSSYKESPRNNYRHSLQHETYKYSSHLNNFNQKSKTDFFPSSTNTTTNSLKYQQQNFTKNNEEKIDYSITSNESMTTDFEIEKATSSPIYDNNNLLIKKKLKADLNIHNLRSPSLLKNIQDLDMSPKSKRIFTDRRNPSSRSFTDETAETDSENYADLIIQQKQNNLEDQASNKKNNFYKCEIDENINSNNKVMIVKPVANLNTIWYNESNDECSGMSVDRSMNETPMMKISDFSSFNRILNENLPMKLTDFDEEQEEKKLFQWPSSSLPLFSNEANSSLDIDDEKIVGILV